MTLFNKWPHCNNMKDVKRFIKKYANAPVLVTEKLDGANVCLVVERGEGNKVRVFSRNGGDFSQMAEVQVALKKLSNFLSSDELERRASELAGFSYSLFNAPREALESYEAIAFYGELINTKLMRRIKYYDGTPQIKLFGMAVLYEGKWTQLPYDALTNFCGNCLCNLPSFNIEVPTVQCLECLRDLDVDALLKMKSKTSTDGAIEGFVIHSLFSLDERPFQFKIKTENFKECCSPARQEQILSDEQKAVKELNNLFLGYFTENRAYAVISKHVEVTNKDISTVTRELFEDAKEDFFRDHPQLTDHPDLKKILNAGSKGFLLIKKVLKDRES